MVVRVKSKKRVVSELYGFLRQVNLINDKGLIQVIVMKLKSGNAGIKVNGPYIYV